MKLSYVTTFDARDLNEFYNWAGTGYYISESLEKQSSIEMQYIGSLKERLPLKILCKLKRYYYESVSKGTYAKGLDPIFLKNYSNQVSQKLSKTDTDIVFGATTTPITYLECKQPIVFWSDATFNNLLDYYPAFKNLGLKSIEHGHQMENMALQRCQLALYASEWAAREAIEYYKADPAKVKVVPFGANIEHQNSLDSVKSLINSRPSDRCKLLFIGYEWARKGGNVVVEVVKELNKSGLNTELTVVGCQPDLDEEVVPFVKVLGVVKKSTDAGKATINKLLAESHFLIVPSRAECYGIVFCEANSFGVPSIASQVGGIPTIIRDDINGKLFDKEAEIQEYCQYISNLLTNYKEYKQLALSSFNEYKSRLNWQVAGNNVREMLETLI